MLNRLYNWYGRRVVKTALVLIIVLIIAGLFLTNRGSESPVDEADSVRIVETKNVNLLLSSSQIELNGTVEAVSEAILQAEASGRVTSVSAALGDEVRAGSIIGQIENKSERAALLQAQGAYELALASAAQADVSVIDAETSLASAKNSALSTYRTSFTTVDDVISNLVDELYGNPDEGIIGFKLDGISSHTANQSRLALRPKLEAWSATIATANEQSINGLLETAERDAKAVADLVELLSVAVYDDDNDGVSISGISIETYRNDIIGARSQMSGVLQNLVSAKSTIENAEEALQRAQLSGTTGDVSSANAAVKQALGILRAAEANVEKTVFRTPVTGTVNELNIKVGDFVGTFDRVARVANNSALLIRAYVGDDETKFFTVGREVVVSGRYGGVISNVAPAFDPETGKIEIIISTEEASLQNGDVVSLAVRPNGTLSDDEPIVLPLTAIKLSADTAYVFTVADGTSIAHKVVLGRVNGGSVEIASGIERDWDVVVDARGLIDGQRVSVSN